jgi:hypothetical protein
MSSIAGDWTIARRLDHWEVPRQLIELPSWRLDHCDVPRQLIRLPSWRSDYRKVPKQLTELHSWRLGPLRGAYLHKTTWHIKTHTDRSRIRVHDSVIELRETEIGTKCGPV